jgi:hypothetical protein
MNMLKTGFLHIIFLLTTAVLVLPQSTPMDERSKPLKIEIAIEADNICTTRSFKIIAEVTNTSGEDLVIDRKMIWYSLSFSTLRMASNRVSSDSRDSINDPGPYHKADFVTLKPKASSKVKKSISDDFFRRPGEYAVETTYGQFKEIRFEDTEVWRGRADSNTMKFRVPECFERAMLRHP